MVQTREVPVAHPLGVLLARHGVGPHLALHVVESNANTWDDVFPRDAGDRDVLARCTRKDRMTVVGQTPDHLSRPEAESLERATVVFARCLYVTVEAVPVDVRLVDR